jgi:hypothetical protein
LQAFRQPSEEALGGISIAPVLNEDNAVLIHSAPETALHALDPMNTSSKCHLSPGPGRRRRRQLAKIWPNFLHQRRMIS